MPTTNPVPSQDPSDLLFNAGKLDEVLNGTGTSFTDRLGTARRTVAGMNADFDAQLADAESDLNVYRADAAASAAEALGYLQTIRATSYGAYASDPATDPLGNPPTVGDEYFNTTANLLKRWNGATWQASDINTANLAAPSGSSLVGYDTGTVQDVLDAVTGPSGAASVGYTTAGGGAVATNVQGKLRETISVGDFGAVGDGIADDTIAFQRAVDSVPASGAVIEAKNRKWNINGVVYITKSNITIDCSGSLFTSSVSQVPIFYVVPYSLILSGRMTGEDYPQNWRHAVTNAPLPVDGDWSTMMYEHNASNRVKNIEFLNCKTEDSISRGMLVAYSVDGLRIFGCESKPLDKSALRFFHCQNISIDKNTLGGAGVYVAFFYKCRDVKVSRNDIKSQILRAVSFKGCYHIDRPIWESIDTDVYGQISMDIHIFGNKFSAERTDPNGPYTDIDSVSIGFDYPDGDQISKDPVGSQGGNPIGFTIMDWRGHGKGYFVYGNIFKNESIPSNKNNALNVGYPTSGITFINNECRNSIVVADGVNNLNVSNNEFSFSVAAGEVIAISENVKTGYPVYSSAVTCSGNNIYTPSGVSGGVSAIKIQANGLEAFGNKIWFPKSGILYGLLLGTGTGNANVHGNKVFTNSEADAGVTVTNVKSSKLNNIFGADNWVISNSPSYSSEVAIGKVDSGKFLQLAQLGELAFMDKSQMVITPPASASPHKAGDMTFQLTSNTQLAVKVRGLDGVVRSANLTLT